MPAKVYHALQKRGRCCGCFPNVVETIIRVTENYHSRSEASGVDIVSHLDRVRGLRVQYGSRTHEGRKDRSSSGLTRRCFLELGAVNQYWLHYRLLEDWGYIKLAKKERAESIEEMHHADKLIARIIFLEGHPNLQSVAPLRIGQNVKEVLESDLAGEYDARTVLQEVARDLP